MTKLILLVAASTLALASCGQPANPNTDPDRNQRSSNDMDSSTMGTIAGASGDMNGVDGAGAVDLPVQAVSAQDYVARAAAADQFEIQSSELVLRQSTNTAVRGFAQQMVSDHTASTAKLMALAKTASLSVPGTGLQAKQQNNMAALRDAGTGMDQVYINQQRAAHVDAIALHRSAATNNELPAPLSAFASSVLPAVEAHSRMLSDIKAAPPRG